MPSILSAATGWARCKVPLTLLLAAEFYLGLELYFGIFVRDNISRPAHVAVASVASSSG